MFVRFSYKCGTLFLQIYAISVTDFVRFFYIFVVPEGTPTGPFRSPEAVWGGVQGPTQISDDF